MAAAPKNGSQIGQTPEKAPMRLERKQPIVSPGMADGVKRGRIDNASLIRSCTAPNEMGANKKVSRVYTAAIRAARTISCVF